MAIDTLDTFYKKIESSILLAQDYLESPEFSSVVKWCRLKPLKFFDDKKYSTIFYKQWIDEYGNILKIIKNQRIIISYNDLSVSRDKLVCTDPYYGLSLENVVKVSKLAFMQIGRDEDLNKQCCLISFLGIDNYLRTYLLLHDEWSNVSPLLWGIKELKTIIKYSDVKYFKRFYITENIRIPCETAHTWITYLPAGNDFIDTLKRRFHYYKIAKLLTKGK